MNSSNTPRFMFLTGSHAKVHASVTCERVMEAVEREMKTLDNPGICLACGEDAYDCEPDARHYECECCNVQAVFGAAEILMCGYYHDSDPG